MKKLESCIFSASKLSGVGRIDYSLWIDTKGQLYVQLVDNDSAGTFTKYLFSVSQYAAVRNSGDALSGLQAFNIDLNKNESVKNNNNGAFLKAVLRDLLPNDE